MSMVGKHRFRFSIRQSVLSCGQLGLFCRCYETMPKTKIRAVLPQRPPHICVTCGGKATGKHLHCGRCKVVVTRQALIEAAKKGRLAAHTSEAEAKRAKSRRLHFAAQKIWNPSTLPGWLSHSVYLQKIQPRLSEATIPVIRLALGVSKGYATNVRSGRRVPHPRHWQILANLVGMTSSHSA